MDWYSQPSTSSAADWNVQNLDDVKRKLITANHILHQQGVVDAYGHISVRCPGEYTVPISNTGTSLPCILTVSTAFYALEASEY